LYSPTELGVAVFLMVMEIVIPPCVLIWIKFSHQQLKLLLSKKSQHCIGISCSFFRLLSGQVILS